MAEVKIGDKIGKGVFCLPGFLPGEVEITGIEGGTATADDGVDYPVANLVWEKEDGVDYWQLHTIV